MMEKKLILHLFKMTNRVVEMQLDGITHEDSLLQLPFRGNCLNWVLGHIVVSRDGTLKRVGQEPIWTEEEGARYQYDSEPIVSADDPGIIHLDRILDALTVGLERLTDGFDELSDTQLLTPDENGRTLADSLHFAGWHEGYHVGQTEYLRQLAGKNDKVI